jgi:rsbT co-antagonist protein RsbR
MAGTTLSEVEFVLPDALGLTTQGLDRRKRYVGLDAADMARIASLRPLLEERVDVFLDGFFAHLGSLDEARGLVASPELADRARRLKREHLLGLVSGDYGLHDANQRVALARLYVRAGIESRVFLGAFHLLLHAIGTTVTRESGLQPAQAFEALGSLRKLAFLDIGLMVDVMVAERQRVILQQQEAIKELTTPVLRVRDRLLLLPIVGVIDTTRAQLITENLLRAIRANRAKVIVMDVTGVATIDSKVANHLIQTITAAQLMGATVVVTGLSSDVSQSLVALGVDLAKVNTVGDLQEGLEEAERILGLRVVRADPDARWA